MRLDWQVVFALLALGLVLVSEAAEESSNATAWNHTSQEDWARDFPLCASESMRPSPIDIHTDQTKYKSNLRIELNNYDHEIPLNLMTTHHSVSVKPNNEPFPSVRLNWLSHDERVFDLQEIHFHWGSDGNHKGSEHAINGNLAGAEMHLVHFKRGINKSHIGKIANSIVVLGVLIEPDDLVYTHTKVDKLVEDLAKVNGTQTDEEFVSEEPELLSDLLPYDYNNFYTYNGSLTTPPCYEVVTWIVMNSPIYMSRDQLDRMANLEFQEPDGVFRKIGPNRRNIQPLHDRPVFASFNVSDSVVPGRKPTDSPAFHDNWRKVIIRWRMNGRGRRRRPSNPANRRRRHRRQ